MARMIRMESVRKAFGSVLAVGGLSLEIHAGEVFGLLGPNGAGKSTSIAMVAGQLRPDSGKVVIAGSLAPESQEVRRLMGMAPQALAIYEDLSAAENLLFFAKMYSLDNPKARASRVLDTVGLTDRANDRAKTFSGGMKRRLNLAISLLHDPKILLLDEPTAGVDPQSRNNILETVRSLAASGVTVVYTTHYMEEAAKLCTRVGIVDKGQMLALGSVSDLIAKHGGPSVAVFQVGEVEQRQPLFDASRDLAGIVARSGADLRGLRIEQPDLERVFLELTGRSLRD